MTAPADPRHLSLLRAQPGDPGAPQTLRQLADAPGAGFLEHYRLGTALLEQRDFAGAEAATRKALAAAPDHPSAHLRMGELLLARRDPRAAAVHLELVVLKEPRQSVGWVLLAQARALAGEVREAWAALERGRERLPRSLAILEAQHALALRVGDGRAALKVAMDLRQLDPKSPDAAYRFGTAALLTGLLAQARDGFAQAVALSPASWKARHGLAKVCAAMGEVDRATAELEAAVALRPAEPEVVNDLAMLWLRRSVPAMAEQVLRRALLAGADDAGVHLNLALALAMLGKGREALPHADQAAASPDAEIAEQGARLRAQLKGKAA